MQTAVTYSRELVGHVNALIVHAASVHDCYIPEVLGGSKRAEVVRAREWLITELRRTVVTHLGRARGQRTVEEQCDDAAAQVALHPGTYRLLSFPKLAYLLNRHHTAILLAWRRVTRTETNQ